MLTHTIVKIKKIILEILLLFFYLRSIFGLFTIIQSKKKKFYISIILAIHVSTYLNLNQKYRSDRVPVRIAWRAACSGNLIWN